MGEEPKPARRWSTRERVAVVVLLSILVVFAIFIGSLFYVGGVGCGLGGRGPCPNMAILNIISHNVNSPTNVTLNVMNAGSVTVNLVSYYVDNVRGQTYANTNWSGPTLPPNTVTPMNILIDGSAFTFQSGDTYTVAVVTSGNYRYTFTFQA
jgi:hypothetical protein